MLFTELITVISSLFIKVSPDYLCCNMNFGFDTYLKKTFFKKDFEDFFRKIIYKKKAILKTRNKGTGNGMQRMRGMRGMFTRIPGNLSEDSGKCYYFNIPRNVEEDSGKCSKRFQGMLVKIPGNAREDSREYWQKYSRMLKRTERFVMQLNENRIEGYRHTGKTGPRALRGPRTQDPMKTKYRMRTQDPTRTQDSMRAQDSMRTQDLRRTQEPLRTQDTRRTQDPRRTQNLMRTKTL